MTGVSADDARGAQLERTALAWNRTGIAVAANGALMLHAGVVHGIVALDVLGAGVAGLGFVLWALSLVRYSTVAGRPVGRLFGGRGGAASLATALVLVLTVADLAVVVFVR